jgi:uncharacterized protein YecA (UPF0149 family)
MKKKLTIAEYEQLQKTNPALAAQFRQVTVQQPIQRQFLSPGELEKLRETDPEAAAMYKPIKKGQISIDQIRQMKIGRNESCPCGSGKKFKKCCLGK